MIKEDILEFMAEVVMIPRRSIRLLGYNYDWIGRVFNRLIKEGYIEEITLNNTRMLTITESYSKKIESQRKEPSFEPIATESENASNIRLDRKDKQKRIIQSGWISSLLYRYTHLKTNLFKKGTRGSEVGDERESDLIYTPMYEIKRSDIKDGLLIRGSRGHGVIELAECLYVIYNCIDSRMKVSPLSEEKLYIYLRRRYKKPVQGIVIIGNERVERLLVEMPSNKYIGGESRPTKYIHLNENGAKQMIVILNDIKDLIKYQLIKKDDIERAVNSVFDGIESDNAGHYIAVDEDISDIRLILATAEIMRIKELTVYCFKWQKEILSDVLKLNIPVKFKILNSETVLKLRKGNKNDI